MQNVGHYLEAIRCFLLNNPFKLLFFPIAWVVSLSFGGKKQKKLHKKTTVPFLIMRLWASTLITHLILRCSSFVTFRFGHTLLKSNSLWILVIQSCSQRGRKKKKKEKKKVYRISLRLWWLSQVSVQGKRRKSAATSSDSFWNFSAIEEQSSWAGHRLLSPCSCSELPAELGFPKQAPLSQRKERSASKLSASQPVTWLPIKEDLHTWRSYGNIPHPGRSKKVVLIATRYQDARG